MIGSVLEGKYRIDALIGKGGYGAVYRASQMQLDRTVAIKVMRELRDDPGDARGFAREALAIARLKHPNIVTIYDFGLDQRVGAFIVMEHLDGRSLRQELSAAGALPVPFAAGLARQIAHAAHAAHAAGVIHRDIKPENVFLEDVGGGRITVKVLDFGIARLSQSRDLEDDALPSLTGDQELVGTFLYVAPEQALSEKVDGRADVYSIGCVLFEMLTGKPPFQAASPFAVVLRHAEESPAAPSSRIGAIPKELDDIVLRALAKKPADRFDSALDLADVLERFMSDRGLDPSLPGGCDVATRQATRDSSSGHSEAGSIADGRVTVADVPTNLPRAVTTFIGRVREVADVRRLVSRYRLVTLTGPGGIGKTRLALSSASGITSGVTSGIWFIDLASITDASLVARTVATALGVREDPSVPVAATIADIFADRECIVLLDNCEHVLDACARLVEALLESCPRVRFLATSREPLAVAGESVWAVPPLGIPDTRAVLAANDYLGLDAVRLFVERARLSVPGYEPDAGEAALIGRLCGRLDGLPLAIELAAARIRVLSVTQISERLGDRFRLLAQRGGSGSDRQRTLKATIDWSYDLLDGPERLLLDRLSVFAGGFTLEAVEHVCTTETCERIEALDRLTNLVTKSLVVVDWNARGNRFRLLESVRQYAKEKLADARQTESLRDRHLDFFRAMTRDGYRKLGSNEGEEFGRLLAGETENIRAALETARESADPVVLFEMAMELWRFWYERGHLAEGREWMEAAIERASDVISPKDRSGAYGRVGSIAVDQGDIDAGSRYHEEAIRIDRERNDESGIAIGLHNLGNVRMLKGDFEEAARLFDESHSILLGIGDEQRTALSEVNRGTTAMERGRYEAARSSLENALQIFRRIGHGYGESLAMEGLCELAARMGDFMALGPLLDETLALSRKIDNKHNLAAVSKLRGVAALVSGDSASAREYCERALAGFREIGDRQCAIETLLCLCDAAVSEENTCAAYAHVCAGLENASRSGFKRLIAQCLERTAEVALAWNRPERAAEMLGAAEALRERIGGPAPPRDAVAIERNKAAVSGYEAEWRIGREQPVEVTISTAMALSGR